MKAALVFGALFCTAIASASPIQKEPARTSVGFDGAAAKELYQLMRVEPKTARSPNEDVTYATKYINLKDDAAGYTLYVGCATALSDGASCLIKFLSPAMPREGRDIRLPEILSQGIVSRFDLKPMPKLGATWKGFESPKFSVFCQENDTPTDLPMYVSCVIRIDNREI